MPESEVYFDNYLRKYVRQVPCNCQNGYRGVDGHTCERCEGSGLREVIVDDEQE